MVPPPDTGSSSRPSPGASSQASEASAADGDEASTDYAQRLLKGSGFILSGSMVGKVVGFLLQLLLTRGLGTVLYGLYTTGMTVLRLGQAVATLGLQNGIVRFGAPQHEAGDAARLKGTFLAGGGLGLLAATALSALLLGTAPWLARAVFSLPDVEPAVLTWTIRVFACGLPFYVLTYLASRMARAVGTMQVDTLLDSILQPALFLALAGGLLLAGKGFTAALYAFLASTVLAALGGLYAVYRLFPPLLSRLRPQFQLGRLLRFSLPVVGITLSSIGLTYTDRLMLSILSTSESVGLYQAAARLSEQMRFVLFAITASFSPIISDLYHRGRLDELARLYADTVRWILLTTLPAAVVLIVFAPAVMSIFGPDFRAGAPLLRVLTGAYLVVAGVGSVGHMLQMSDHQDFAFGVSVAAALLNVGLNWVFIQWYGAIGAAFATGITQALSNVAEVMGLRYFVSIQPYRWTLWKPLLAAALAGLLAWGLHAQLTGVARWALGAPLSLGAYGGMLLLLGLHPRDRSIATALWRRAWAAVR